MSTIKNSTFNSVISSGLDNYYEVHYGFENSIDETFDGFKNLVNAVGDNPMKIGSVFTLSGTVLSGSGIDINAASSDYLDQLRVRLRPVSGTSSTSPFAIWNQGGTGIGEGLENGENVTLNNFGIDCKRVGVAEALKKGNSSLVDHVYLLDGTGSSLTTGNGWADASAPQTFTADDTGLRYTSPVQFENTSGSTQTVEGVKVVYEGNNYGIINDTSFTATLSPGDILEFTTLELNINSIP